MQDLLTLFGALLTLNLSNIRLSIEPEGLSPAVHLVETSCMRENEAESGFELALELPCKGGCR